MSDPDSGYPTPRDDYTEDNPVEPSDLTPVKNHNFPAISTPFAGSSIKNLGDIFSEGLTPIRHSSEERNSTEDAKKFINYVRNKKRSSPSDKNLKEQLSRIEELVNEKSRTIESLEGHIDALNHEKENMNDKLNESHQIIAETNVNLEVHSLELEEANKVIENLTNELNSLRKDNFDLDKETVRLKEVVNARDEHIKHIEKTNGKLNVEVKNLETAQKLMLEAKQALDDERKQFLAKEKKIQEDAEINYNFYKKQIEDLQAERDHFLSDKEETSKTLSAGRKQEIRLLEENEDLRKQILDFENKTELLSNELRITKSRENDIKAAKERCDLQLADLLNDKKNIDTLKSNLASVTELKDKFKVTITENENQIEELKKTIKKLEKQVGSFNSEIEKQSVKITDLKGMNEELVSSNIEQKNKISELTRKLGNSEKTLHDLKITTTKSKEDCDKLTDDLLKSESEKKILKEKCSRLVELEGLNAKLSEEVAFLRKELETHKSVEEVEKLEAQLALSYNANAQLVEENACLREREEEVRQSLMKAESLKFELKGREDRISKIEKNMDTLEKELATVKHERDLMTSERIALINEFDAVREAHEHEKAKLMQDVETLNSRLVQLEALDGYPGQMSFDAMNRTVWDVVPREVRGVLENLKKDSAEIRSIVDKMQKITVESSDRYGSTHSIHLDLGHSRPQSRINNSNSSTLVGKSVKVFDDLIQSLTDVDLSDCEEGTPEIRQYIIKFLRTVAFDTENTNKSMLQFLENISRLLERRSDILKQDLMTTKSQLEEIKQEHRTTIRDLGDQRVHLAAAEEHVRLLRKDIDERDRRYDDLKRQLDRLVISEKRLNKDMLERDEELKKSARVQQECLIELEELMAERQEVDAELKKREDALMRALADIEELHRKLILADESLSESSAQVNAQNSIIQQLEIKVKSLTRQLQHELKTKKYNQDTMEMCLKLFEQEEEYVKRLRRRNSERQNIIEDLLAGKEVGEKMKRKLSRFITEDNDDSAEVRKHQHAWSGILRQRQVDPQNVLKERSDTQSSAALSGIARKTSTPNQTLNSVFNFE